jgi:RimJ/RimL family protein N-acetyltransferase
MTGMALASLSNPELRHLTVDVVAGINYPHGEALHLQGMKRPDTRLHRSQPSLADLTAQADLAIGAGGGTTWERMCLGVPTVIVTIADNQRPAAEALAAAGLIHYAGHSSEVSAESLSKAVIGWVSDPSRLPALSIQNQLRVDGLGALRILEALWPTDTAQIRLRAAGREDVVSYFNWVNDPEVRKSSIHTEAISWVSHQAWFEKKLNDSNSHLYVLEAAGLPVGQIRFDREGNEAKIDYSLDPLVRGRGWGSRLVALGSERMQETGPMPLRADVKRDNEASRSVFLSQGFALAESRDDMFVFYRRPEEGVKPLQ